MSTAQMNNKFARKALIFLAGLLLQINSHATEISIPSEMDWRSPVRPASEVHRSHFAACTAAIYNLRDRFPSYTNPRIGDCSEGHYNCDCIYDLDYSRNGISEYSLNVIF